MRLRWRRSRPSVPPAKPPRSRRAPASASASAPPPSTPSVPPEAGSAPSPAAARRAVSPLNRPVWRLSIAAAVGCAVAFLAARVLNEERFLGVWAAALAGGWAWLAAVRLLLLDSRWPRVWSVYLGLSLVPLLLSGGRGEGWVPSLILGGIFLLFRRYRPLRHLTSRRRMWLFFLALGACLLTVLGWVFPPAEGLGASHAYGQSFLRYALGCLQLFWILVAFHLVLGMRLHFMRLRPKLVASAVFVAVVPLIFVLLQGVAIMFGVVGGTLATGGRQLLRDWAELASADAVAGRALFGTTFAARQAAPAPADAPAWLPRFWAALAAPVPAPVPASAAAAGGAETGADAAAGGGGARDGRRDAARADRAGSDRGQPRFVIDGDVEGPDLQIGRRWAPCDSTFFLHTGPELWVLRLQRETADSAWAATGYRVDESVMAHLAAVMQADVGVRGGRAVVFGDADDPGVRATLADSTRVSLNILGRLARQGAQPDSVAGLWERPRSLGAAVLNMLRLGEEGLVYDAALLHVRLAPADIWRGLASGENEFNQAVLIVLAILGFFLLIFVAFAVLLGVRIAGGITSAVAQLHEGTVHLAAGDLETRIEVPNEDEFGDLADSFNEMTAAVKRGRDEAIERERLERELQTAREIQERLLPHAMPDLPGYEVTGTSVPSLQVGGDYFDFLELGDGRLGVAIADVSGKGIPAALLMANLQALLQGQVIHPSDVAGIVARINDLLSRSTDASRGVGIGRFATFFYGVLERETGAFTFTNAGHNPPLLRRADGTLIELKTGGLILGMMSGMPYAQETVTLEPGDVVVLFTDGITEAQGPVPAMAAAAKAPAAAGKAATATAAGSDGPDDDGEDEDDEEADDFDEPVNLFGDDKLRDILAATGGRSAAEIRAAILEAVREHVAEIPPSDDITLVVLKRQS